MKISNLKKGEREGGRKEKEKMKMLKASNTSLSTSAYLLMQELDLPYAPTTKTWAAENKSV